VQTHRNSSTVNTNSCAKHPLVHLVFHVWLIGDSENRSPKRTARARAIR